MGGERNVTRLVAAIVAVAMVAMPAAAQVTTGTLTGTVKDAQGAIIPGATVTLTSDTRGTQLPDVVSNSSGDFTFVNVAPDVYTIQITMDGFKTLRRGGVPVSAGDRYAIGTLVVEVGGLAETVSVTGETSTIQASSGERSFTVSREAVENLPVASRSYMALAVLSPGVMLDGNQTPVRIGGGGDPNIMMDGVSAMDTGSNRPLLQMNVESIAEVKVLTSGYQAEYGRSSGVQVTAITKSGTNRFRGSVYDVERDSDWYSNTKTNKLNNDPKAVLKERDLGYSIGGPIGKPGGNNKLFFFYSQEFSPRTAGNNVIRYRMPTALERVGDFSQTTDQNGALYPYIKDPRSSLACGVTNNVVNTAGCFQDGGVVGRIPADMLYQPGLNILRLYPLPNIANVPAAQNYNYEITRPEESVLSWQPAGRVDYQPTQKLRVSAKYSAWMQRSQVFNGTIPGFNDTRMQDAPVVSYTTSVNYTLTPTMFIEATYGHSQNELAGCAQAQSSTGAIFCNNAAGTQGIQVSPFASLAGANLQGLPFLFPDATVLDPDYYAVKALNEVQPAFWDGVRMSKVPAFQWGNRVSNAPPTLGFPGWLNINSGHDFAISLTKITGRHTIKTGFYTTHSYKAEQVGGATALGTINFQQDAVGTNQFDTSFGFANAAIGTFSSFQQARKYVETASVYRNLDFYAQDNWKVSNRLTLDYGMRFVHQGAQYDKLGQASNFLPDRWSLAQAPLLYRAGCIGASPCTGNNRVAVDPRTGQSLGSGTSVAIGTLVPGTGDQLNGLFLPGGDIPKATYDAPALSLGPRFGAAYDLSGSQSLIVRGGFGLFFDRPFTTALSGGVNNPPSSATVTAQYAQLQSLGAAGLSIQGAPGLTAINFDSKIPASTQWNIGTQAALPWATTVDVSYVGSKGYDLLQQVNINAIDFGAAFLSQNQDPTQSSTTPGAAVISNNQMRSIQGYGNINMFWNRGWRTYHSVQLSFQRRFQNGLAFGFNDTIGLSDRQQAGVRLQHNADGSYSIRDDQAQADELLGQNNPVRNVMRANFIWDLPDLTSSQPAWKAIGLVLNDWQISGIWSGARRGANVTAGNSAVPSSAYTVGFSYANGGNSQNLTGSPDYGARVAVISDPGKGCSDDLLRQFNTSAFRGPAVGSVGLESGTDYLTGCFISALDVAIRRNIRLGGSRVIELRADVFNVFNQAGITGRNTTMNLTNPSDPTTVQNLPFNADGTVIDARSRPRGAGFGVATGFQDPRTVQLQIRFSF